MTSSTPLERANRYIAGNVWDRVVILNFILLTKFRQKEIFLKKIKKIVNELILEFLFVKSEGKLVKKDQIFIFGFECIAKNLERVCNQMVYKQIWLNLLRGDHHSFYIFLWMITTLNHHHFHPFASADSSHLAITKLLSNQIFLPEW
jgi:hypothetical protein